MPSIDERVVSMAFENQVFEQRVSTTMSTLDKLDAKIKNIGTTSGFSNIEAAASKVTLQQPMSALDRLKSKLSGAGSGAAQGLGEIDKAGNKVTLEGPSRAIDKTQAKLNHLSSGSTFTDIEKSASRVSLQGLTNALDNAKNKFSVLEGAASVALGNIASKAAMKGVNFASSFAFGPARQGFEEYQTNLGSIQTILSNTQGQQVSGLGATNKYLGELNTYSDKTIYNFSEMAKNIGTFTAAGVDLPKATSSIKGIANLAAMSGSNSQQAATAMYQLSQAISSGKVGLQDWNSVVNAGMGGAVFQKALARTAVNMGQLKASEVDVNKETGKLQIQHGSFRESISGPGPHWLTGDVLTNTLKQLSGDMSAAELKAQGFTDAQVKAIQAQAKTAQDAATQVKTLPQVFDIARETLGSGWAKTFQTIFGNFTEAKKTFTDLSNTINGFINANANARNKVLGDWKKLGGRTELIKGIKVAFQDIMAVLKPIKDAFRDIFPAQTGKSLFELTKNFRQLMENLKPSEGLIRNLRSIFGGLFAVIHIGWTVVKEFVGVIFDLFGAVGKGSGGFLGFVAGIGEFLKSVDAALTKGGALHGLFQGLGAIISVPLKLLLAAGKAIAGLFGADTSGKAKGVESSLQGVNDKLGPLKGVIDKVVDAWHQLVDIVGQVKTALDPWFSQMAQKLSGVGDIIVNAFKGINVENVMQGLQTGFIGGIFLTLKKALGGGGALDEIKKTLGGVNSLLGGFTGQLEAMQSKLHAEALLAIAAAVAVLAAGIFILSTIPADKLTNALSATAIGLGELMGAMKLMTSGMGKLGVLQLPIIAAGLIGLSVAVVILAGAMKIFATMSWEDIGKGLVGVAGSLAAVGLAMKLMPPTMPLMAAGLVLVALALNAMGSAVMIFSSMSWENLGKGLLGMAVALGMIGAAMILIPPTTPLIGAGLILVGAGLVVLGGAIASFGNLDMKTMVQGILGAAGAIIAIGLAVTPLVLLGPLMVLAAAGLVLVSVALVGVAAAIGVMGKLKITTMLKGLYGLGAALVVLAAGLTLMVVALPGAAALMVAAVALTALVPALGILGTMQWSTIFKGLAAIALVMVSIGVAGLLAAPGLVALGIALIPLGLGFMVVAAAAKIFASAVSVLSSEGQKGFAVLLAAITGFIALIPTLILSLVKGLLSTVEEVAKLAPKIISALDVILTTVIAFIIREAPKLATAVGALVTAVVTIMSRDAPKLIAAGLGLLNNLLSGISRNIGQVTVKVAEIITKFLNALATKMPSLVTAGANTLIAFIRGITAQIPRVVATVANMVVKFITALGSNVSKIVNAGQNMMIKFMAAIAGFVPKMVRKGGEIILRFLDGLLNFIPRVTRKGADVVIALINGITQNLNRVANKGADAVIKFLHGLATTIRTKGPQLVQAGLDIADALVDGIANGFGLKGGLIKKALDKVFSLLPGWAKKALGIHSPSTVFAEIGGYTMMGFAKGVEGNHGLVQSSGETMANGLIDAVKTTLGVASPSQVMKDIGKEVVHGFKDGLDGSADDIKSSFVSLRDKITTEIDSLRGDIKSGRDSLKEDLKSRQDLKGELKAELAKPKKDQDAARIKDLRKQIRDTNSEISDDRKTIASNVAEYEKLGRVRQFVRVGLADERKRLQGLSNEYDKVSKQLEDAQKVLDEATQKRDEAFKSFTDQYSKTPDIGGLLDEAMSEAEMTADERRDALKKKREEEDRRSRIDQVANYKKALLDQIEATKKYNDTLQKLRGLGLDDTTYQKLLDMGLSGQEFADQLLRGGKGSIDQINQLDSDLLKQGTTLAKNASKNLYQAGVDIAQGIVNGLKAKKKDLEVQMNQLGEWIVNAIKKKLGIKSPSKVMTQMGENIGQGVVKGLAGTEQDVGDAAAAIGTTALSRLQDSMEAGVASNIDVNPVVTPVLDLSQVKKDAVGLGDALAVAPVQASYSTSQASTVSNQVQPYKSSGTALYSIDRPPPAAAPTVSYVQNNYSPDPLSNIELYRQTHNQLSGIKSIINQPTMSSPTTIPFYQMPSYGYYGYKA